MLVIRPHNDSSNCSTTITGDVMVSDVADKEEVVLMTEGVLLTLAP